MGKKRLCNDETRGTHEEKESDLHARLHETRFKRARVLFSATNYTDLRESIGRDGKSSALLSLTYVSLCSHNCLVS